MHNEKIAIVAGGGLLPQLVARQLQKQDIAFITLGLVGSDSDINADYQVTPGQVQPVLDILRKELVTTIVFAGHIKRPGLLSLKVDMIGAKLLAKIMAAKVHGDNTVLSIIASFLEDQGFKVVSPNQILPSLLTPKHVLGSVYPDQADLDDIVTGKMILASLGEFDIGQAVVVENGYTLGIEAAEGTDELIVRCGKIKREEGKRGVLIKMKKVKQDQRLDLPTIGEVTIEKILEAGLRGVAIEAGASLVVDAEAVIKLADKHGVFVVGV